MNQMLGEKRDSYRVEHLAPRLNCLPHRSSAFLCTLQRARQTARWGRWRWMPRSISPDESPIQEQVTSD